MDGENVTILIAFAAGVLSFASPCVLPLVPAYLGHMVTVSGENPRAAPRMITFVHATAFVAGFSMVFVGFWAAIGSFGYLVLDNARYMQITAGAVLIFMGMHLLGVINLPFMNREYVVSGKEPVKPGYSRSLLMGMMFAAGWTPCIGPVLGSIIGLAVMEDALLRGVVLLVAYSLGLGVPFLIMALAVNRISAWLRRARPLLAAVPVVSGLLVMTVGLLMLTNSMVRVYQFFDWGYA
jgi:cytochrome c-type biogenesis protein